VEKRDEMSLTDDEPLNELENQLLSLMRGEISQEDFLRDFLDSHLYILVDGEPQGGVLGDRKPMVIAANEQAPRMLAVFSAPTRATRMLVAFPEYAHPILVDCSWVLEHIGPRMGISFNPGCQSGFELAAEGAHELQKALLDARAITDE
jgi:hypothetical protein